VLRVLDKETPFRKIQKLSLDVVGFSSDETRRFRRYIPSRTHVLVTGRRVPGKTTTLYAASTRSSRTKNKIVTH